MICKRAKKIKRDINRSMRRMNQNIVNDNLWRGRFEVRMEQFQYCWYEDKSGIDARVLLRYIDLKTGKVWRKWYDDIELSSRFGGWRLFSDMNNFIVEECKVWDMDRDDPNHPRNDKTVYRR